MTSTPMQTLLAENRVLRAVRAVPGVRGDTVLGSVVANTYRNKDGEERIRVQRTEAWDLTPEQWQGIAEGLHLDTVQPGAEG
ncbi:hypothetical protein SEA_OTTAWA_22 [Arthrobacter phage Ottawa]|nr:hypothetical protein SEA_KHARCHO_22 [Arthrobacter phage Kharcho]WIC89254.1 hypothetical protein SEA_OTTAWA_22 [Arthrobacter phage Ottawa]